MASISRRTRMRFSVVYIGPGAVVLLHERTGCLVQRKSASEGSVTMRPPAMSWDRREMM